MRLSIHNHLKVSLYFVKILYKMYKIVRNISNKSHGSDEFRPYQSARKLLPINFMGRCSCLSFSRSSNRELKQHDSWNTQDGRMKEKCRLRLGMHSLAPGLIFSEGPL